MFKFIFLYLLFCTITDISSMARKAPATQPPQQRFSIFKSLDIDHEKQLVYREIIPIIATGDKQESLDFRSFILENKRTGVVAFQIQISYYTNTDTMINKSDKSKPVESFDILSIAFISNEKNRNNDIFLPIVKLPQQLLNKENLTKSYIGSIYLFPDDITNLITSITKEPLSIIQPPFPESNFTQKKLTQQSSNQFLPKELSIPSKELYITLKNSQGDEITLSFSPYYTAILRSALEFYIKLL